MTDDDLLELLQLTRTVADCGIVEWRNSIGKLHRIHGPAVEWPPGDRIWYRNGQPHRTDGPAIERANGSKEWWENGQLHRVGQPAIERVDDGAKEWWENGTRIK